MDTNTTGFVESIINKFKMDINNDGLHNELFDLLGFDRLDLISLILDHIEVLLCHLVWLMMRKELLCL